MIAHPLHPAVVHFPFGLLLTSTLVDLAHLGGLWHEPHFAAWLMAFGLVAALVAVGAGLYDFQRLAEAQVPHALRHMGTMVVAVGGYAIALYLRRGVFSEGGEVATASLAVSIVSAAILGFGGWLGGELVYRYGAGRIDR